MHDHVGAHGILLDGGHGVAVGAGALPFHALLLAELAGADGDLVGHHKGGVEAHAELPDDAEILGLAAVHLALELVGAGLGDNAQVVFGLLQSHADAVVAHGDGTLVFIHKDVDLVVFPAEAHAVVGQGQVTELVDGVGRVGDDLPEEDLLIGVNGIDHQVEQTLAFGLELLFAHDVFVCLPCFCDRSGLGTGR